MVFIFTTCRDMAEAKKIGELIVKEKLAASINFWPSESMYLWEDVVKESHGVVLRIKTLENKVQDIEDIIAQYIKHPFIEMVDVKRINQNYKAWIAKTIK